MYEVCYCTFKTLICKRMCLSLSWCICMANLLNSFIQKCKRNPVLSETCSILYHRVEGLDWGHWWHDVWPRRCESDPRSTGAGLDQEGQRCGHEWSGAPPPILPLGHGGDPHGPRVRRGGQHRARLCPLQQIHHVRRPDCHSSSCCCILKGHFNWKNKVLLSFTVVPNLRDFLAYICGTQKTIRL